MLFFSIYDEKWRYRGKTVSEKWRHQALVAFSARHSSRTKHRSRILSYSFDIQSWLHKYERLACRVCGNGLEKFVVNLPKKLNYITPSRTAKMPPITTVNAWPSWIDARRQYILLVVIIIERHYIVLKLSFFFVDLFTFFHVYRSQKKIFSCFLFRPIIFSF